MYFLPFFFSSKEFEKEPNGFLRQLDFTALRVCFNPGRLSSHLGSALLFLAHPVHQCRVRLHVLFVQGDHHGGPSPLSPSSGSAEAATLLRLLLLLVVLAGLRVLAGRVGAGGGERGELMAELGVGGDLQADL